MSATKARAIGPRQIVAMAVIIVVLIIAVAAIVASRTPSATTAAAHDHTGAVVADGVTTSPESSAPVAAPAADQPLPEPPEPEIGAPGTAPETTLADAASAPIDAAVAPRIRDVTALGAPRAPISPDSVMTEATATGGCLPEYGDAGQCLPVIPPSLGEHYRLMVEQGLDPSTMPHPWSCDEARLYFPDGLTLRQAGNDPSALDRNGDAIACGAGD